MLEVAEADLELQLGPCEGASGMPQITRRARRRVTIGVPGLHDGAWSRRARPRCTELTVTGDRGFESSSLQRRVGYEPEILDHGWHRQLRGSHPRVVVASATSTSPGWKTVRSCASATMRTLPEAIFSPTARPVASTAPVRMSE